MVDEHPARTNHIPIISHLDISIETHKKPPRPNFRATNWKEFKKVLAMKLEGLDAREDINSESEFFSHMDKLTCSVTEVIDTCIPKSGLVPYQKRWWSQALAVRCTEACRLACRAYNRRTEPEDLIHSSHKAARRINATMVE